MKHPMMTATGVAAMGGYAALQWLGHPRDHDRRAAGARLAVAGPDGLFAFRSRMSAGPWWVTAGLLGFIVPADFVMSRQMLHGVKARAERTTAEEVAAARPPTPSDHVRSA